jgi:hypothetical protein
VFTAGESLMLSREDDIKALHFDFVRRLLALLLQHGLEPNARFSQRTQHVLQVQCLINNNNDSILNNYNTLVLH